LMALTVLGDEYKLWRFWISASPRVTSSLLCLNVNLGTLLPQYFSLNAKDQVSHPYKTVSIIIMLYTFIFALLHRRQKKNVNWTAANIPRS
jgi:hypothetical protein